MYVWLRFARMAATTGSRGPYVPGGASRLSFRCLPTDIDFNFHLNNARYLMLADLGRVDIFMRSGLFSLMRQRNWAPMMGGVQTAFVREIRLWKRFEVVSTLETWDRTQVIGRHEFVLEGGEVSALTMTTAGIYDRAARRFVPVEEVFAALGYENGPPRALDETERAFLTSHSALRVDARRGRAG